MATIIIIGAGLGGMSAAYELKAELGKQHDVILVNDKPDFEFNPSNPWIAVRWRERKDISLPIEPHVKKKGIRFIHAALTGLQHLEQPAPHSPLKRCRERARRRAAPPASAPSPTQRSASTVSTGCSTNRVR